MSKILESGNLRGMSWKITDDEELILGTSGEKEVCILEDYNKDGKRHPFFAFSPGFNFFHGTLPPWVNAEYKDGVYRDSGGEMEYTQWYDVSLKAPIKKVKMEGPVKFTGNMEYLFASGVGSYEEIDLSLADTTDVVNMKGLFQNCYNMIKLDISSFDTSKVEDMSQMFGWCQKLPSIDISHFDMSNVNMVLGMFEGCGSVKSLDLSNLNISKRTHFTHMVTFCDNLETLKFPNFDDKKDYDVFLEEVKSHCPNLILDDSKFSEKDMSSRKPSKWNVFKNVSKKNISNDSYNGYKSVRIFNDRAEAISMLVKDSFIHPAGKNSVGNDKFDIAVPKNMMLKAKMSKDDEKYQLFTSDFLLSIHNDSLKKVGEYSKKAQEQNDIIDKPEQEDVPET